MKYIKNLKNMTQREAENSIPHNYDDMCYVFLMPNDSILYFVDTTPAVR